MHSWWLSLSDNGVVIASNWERENAPESPGWWAFNSSLTASAFSQSLGLGCNQSLYKENIPALRRCAAHRNSETGHRRSAETRDGCDPETKSSVKNISWIFSSTVFYLPFTDTTLFTICKTWPKENVYRCQALVVLAASLALVAWALAPHIHV